MNRNMYLCEYCILLLLTLGYYIHVHVYCCLKCISTVTHCLCSPDTPLCLVKNASAYLLGHVRLSRVNIGTHCHTPGVWKSVYTIP